MAIGSKPRRSQTPVAGAPKIPTLAYRSVRGVTRLVGAAVDTVLRICGMATWSTRTGREGAIIGLMPVKSALGLHDDPSRDLATVQVVVPAGWLSAGTDSLAAVLGTDAG